MHCKARHEYSQEGNVENTSIRNLHFKKVSESAEFMPGAHRTRLCLLEKRNPTLTQNYLFSTDFERPDQQQRRIYYMPSAFLILNLNLKPQLIVRLVRDCKLISCCITHNILYPDCPTIVASKNKIL